MTPAWQKRGRIIAPAGAGLQTSHAMLPTPMLLADRIRVFFASCDADLRGRIFFADVDRAPPFALMQVSTAPSFDLGPAGAFDADGVNPCHILERDGAWHLYYIGWQRLSAEIPYTLLAGLAVSTDQGQSFTRLSDQPILPPRPGERCFRTAPFVRRTAAGFDMLYIGGDGFSPGPGGKLLPSYALRHHASPDGISWTETPTTLLEPDPAADEIGFGRPFLWTPAGSGPALMISVRTTAGYRLAQMPFGRTPPDLQPVLTGPAEPWESDMTCFGAPIRVDDHELLFYNGNAMGRTGCGLATRRPGEP